MKRFFILFLLMMTTASASVYCRNTANVEDSLLQVLNTLPADSSRLPVLYSLAYQDPMASSCLHYLKQLLEEATKLDHKQYQCLSMYAHVVYYYNHQDEKNTVDWMNKLSALALKHKIYNLYFAGKRAEITMHILKHKIEYSITQAQEMYTLASELKNEKGMSLAKLCLMDAYLMSGRYKEGEEAGFEAYRLLSPNASLEVRKDVLQDIALGCFSTQNKDFLKYLQEYETVLKQITKNNMALKSYRGSYLLLESLYTDYYLNLGMLDKARIHLKKMDKYYSPTSFVPSRGLYFHAYSHYYQLTKEYDKALAYSDTAISLLSQVADNGGINYKIERASILTEAGRLDEAIPQFRSLLAKKDSFYKELSTSQMQEIYQMHNMDKFLLEEEQHKMIIHSVVIVLIAIALLILIPSTLRICYIRKKLKKEEKEIRQMSCIAKETNEVKSRFLANMSYNIRIPLNNVLGFSQLMSTDASEVEASQWNEYSEIIQSNATELIQLVNDVLDLSRLEAGRTKWQIQEYDIIPLCSDAISMVRMKSGNKIEVNFQTDIETHFVKVDITRFTEVIVSTLTYIDPCEEKRDISFYLHHNVEKGLLVFRIANSPLADPALQTQKVEVRHNINRLTIEYFGGTYIIEPDASEGPTLIFTYPSTRTTQESE